MAKFNILIFTLLTLIWTGLYFNHPWAKPFLSDWFSRHSKQIEKSDWNIRISSKGMRQLEESAQLALSTGFLIDAAKKWVPCEVYAEGSTFPCKIRLRGDLPRHWQSTKRSYRVRFTGEWSPWGGFKKVDLILPEDKGHESELLVYRLAKDLELIAPAAGFSSVSINNVPMGAYFWKQAFSGSMFEVNSRTEGAVFRENNIWWFAQNARGIYKNIFLGAEGDTSDLRAQPMLYAPVFMGNAASKDSYSRFAYFLKNLREKKDLDHLLNHKMFFRWLALCITMGSIHSTLPDNLAWFLNPSTGKFEPIIYDVLPKRMSDKPLDEFKFKSFITNRILEAANSSHYQIMSQALDEIEKNIGDHHHAVVNLRSSKGNDAFTRYSFSKASAFGRLDLIRHNIFQLRQQLALPP
jgi:hypothetical protein